MESTISPFILKRPKKDAGGKLAVSHERDNPPIDDGHVACIAFAIEREDEKWKLKILNIFDKDHGHYRKMMRCLPGGRLRHETELDAILNEVLEETGGLINTIDLLPLCRITRTTNDLRGPSDAGTGKQGQFYEVVFGFCGGNETDATETCETTDNDAEDPKWWSLEDIIGGTIKYYQPAVQLRRNLLSLKMLVENEYYSNKKLVLEQKFNLVRDELREVGDKTWLISHVIILLRSLECMSNMLSDYVDTEKNVSEIHSHDLRCLRQIRKAIVQAGRIETHDYRGHEEQELIQSFVDYLNSFDLISITAQILGKDPKYDANKIQKLLANYDPVEPLGAEKYLTGGKTGETETKA